MGTSPILSFDSSTGSVVLRGDNGNPFQTNLSQIQSLKQSGAINADGTVNMSVASGQDGAVPTPVPMQVDDTQGVPPPSLGSPSTPNARPMQMLRPVPGVPVPQDQPIQPATGGSGEAGISAPMPQQPQSSAQPAQHTGGLGGGFLGQYQQQSKQLMAAQDAQAQAAMNQAKNEADVQRQQLQEQEKVHAEQQQAQADRQKHRDQLLQTYQRAANDFDQISTKVDPGQYTAGMNMPQKFLAILGIGLGAAGKGPNIAAEMVNKAIEQNIDAQKFQIQSNLAKGKAKAEGAQNMLDFFQRSMNDDLLAEQATRKFLQDKFQKQLDATSAQFKSPQVQANYQALKAQTGQQTAQTAQSMASQIDNMATQKALAESEIRKNNAEALKAINGDKGGSLTGEQLEKQVHDYGTDVKQLQDLKDAVKKLRQYVQPSGSIPGAGVYDSHKPDSFESKADTDVRQAAKQAAVGVAHFKFGARGASPQEQALLAKAYGLDLGTEQNLRQGLGPLEQYIREQEASVLASYNPQAVAIFNSRRPRTNADASGLKSLKKMGP